MNNYRAIWFGARATNYVVYMEFTTDAWRSLEPVVVFCLKTGKVIHEAGDTFRLHVWYAANREKFKL